MLAIVLRTVLTLMLVLLAIAGAGAVTYGTDPRMIRADGGLEWIMFARRWQWPIAAGSLLACVGLVGMVMAGWRRVWWLGALLPVLGLFYLRFSGEPWRRVGVVEGPAFVAAQRADFLRDESEVVGLVFEGTAYVYPCGALARSPVIVHADGDKRVAVMYSAIAGRATAATADHSVKAREMDVVSMPAGATLILNSRIGQFINAFTGLTTDGKRPAGFGHPIETTRTTWKHWRTRHPKTQVLSMSFPQAEMEQPALKWPEPAGGWTTSPTQRVALLATTRPIALPSAEVRKGDVVNVSTAGANVLLIRDAAGTLRAFDRTVKGDLFPRFVKKSVAKRPEIGLFDAETRSFWTTEGKCVEGFAKEEQLKAIRIEEGVLWGTEKVFYPQAEMISAEAIVAGRAGEDREPEKKPAPAKPGKRR